MGASCYLCELNMAVFPATQVGDAVGACRLCGVLACSGHAQRDPGGPSYECAICTPNVLAVAAMRHAQGTAPPPPQAPGPGGGGPAGATPGAGYVQRAASVDDVTDVIADFEDERWQGVRDDVAYLDRYLASADMPAALRMSERDARARRLMAAAAALAVHVEMPAREMTTGLALVADAVRVGARR